MTNSPSSPLAKMSSEHEDWADAPVAHLEAELVRLSDPVHEQLEYYVYRLVDPQSGETFYVGKGKGGRPLQHVADARSSKVASRKLDRIRAIEGGDRRVSFLIHRHGLTEKEAYEVEAALIDAYPHALNEADGHHNEERGCMPLSELLAKYDPPKRQVTVPAVLINIGQEWQRGMAADSEKLYERTRRYWACDPERHRAAKYAFAASRGIIREVYAIQGWSRHDMRTIQYDDGRARTPNHKLKTLWRWSFEGKPAPEMRDYVGTMLDPPRKPFAANPISWVNC